MTVTVKKRAVAGPDRLHINGIKPGVLYRAFNGNGELAGVCIAVGIGRAFRLCREGESGHSHVEITNLTWRFERADDIQVTLENDDV